MIDRIKLEIPFGCTQKMELIVSDYSRCVVNECFLLLDNCILRKNMLWKKEQFTKMKGVIK